MNLSEQRRIGRGAFVGVAHVDVREARARLDTPARVDAICSAGVVGSAGLSFLRGAEPVIATATTTGRMGEAPIRLEGGERAPV